MSHIPATMIKAWKEKGQKYMQQQNIGLLHIEQAYYLCSEYYELSVLKILFIVNTDDSDKKFDYVINTKPVTLFLRIIYLLPASMVLNLTHNWVLMFQTETENKKPLICSSSRWDCHFHSYVLTNLTVFNSLLPRRYIRKVSAQLVP